MEFLDKPFEEYERYNALIGNKINGYPCRCFVWFPKRNEPKEPHLFIFSSDATKHNSLFCYIKSLPRETINLIIFLQTWGIQNLTEDIFSNSYTQETQGLDLSLIHISEPTRRS